MIKKTVITAAKLGLVLGVAASLNSVALAQAKLSPEELEDKRKEAQQFFADGDLQQALNSINQFIIASPADIRARFFRAQMLAALGRGEEIIEELKLMSRLNLPKEDIQKAKNLITAIERDGRPWEATLTVRAAYGQTDNINSWPKGGERTSGGSNFPLPDPVNNKFDKISDDVAEGSVGVRGKYGLNDNRDLNVLFGFSGKRADGADTVNQDATTISANLGLEKEFANGMTSKFSFSRTNIDRVNEKDTETVNTDMAVNAMKFEVGRDFGENNSGGYSFTTSSADHKNTGTADLSDGTTETHTLFLGGLLGDRTFIRGTFSYAEASSDLENDTVANVNKSKDRVNKATSSFTLIGVHVLPYSQRIIGTATYKEVNFDEQEVDTGVKRKDTSQIYTLGYSIKGEQLWSPLGDVSLGIDVSRSKTSSNQDSADVTANKIMFSLTKKFDL